ncbi:antibiotic biosynthesis monooxygenase [Neoasaia chiangmaiensis NBRC 101099]|uniref:Antibiotic biosynthesis monooxygenase n=1 Tax=Neoasaia chiangmaiensis TaxID=320497 RepID=A0A1U9KRW7_9PROT|nr:putative quinol monooxygenase [Neoasaia chiangmaiensis]AQS88502.1 antibiotic biosynthesis monooxygenase [Neoasaia chiangmaiensis]GBR36465.1 antibiotic biosynthesis monooxygenase [Neoasaia chiangmaiensis NBRC 101099]GEN15331.1 antibiotic biosynthesis monooxygenase [Neoasaia chiangmaiensis]
MATPRCTLTATLHARPEKREELQALLETFIDKSRSEPGCLEYHLQVSSDDPLVFMFYENWVERGDLDRHMALDYQQAWFKRQPELLAKPAEMRFFDMVSQYDR